MIKKFQSGSKWTFTPLGYAIDTQNQEGTRAILDVAEKDKEVLKEVLTTANLIVKLSGCLEYILTPLGYAIDNINNENQEGTRAILDVAEKNNILKEVFVGIEEEYDHKRLKEILETLKNQEQNEEQKTKIDGWLEILAKNVPSNHKSDKHPLAPESSIPKAEENIANNEGMFKIESNISKIENSDKYPQKDTVKTINRSIMIGSVCGVVAALAAGGGCFAAGVALPILALIGIAVAAALVIGVIAGGITYSVLKPCSELDKPSSEAARQQVDGIC
nr:hypothetical protein [Wolbachia endosymbiont of Drosophila mauritiana]